MAIIDRFCNRMAQRDWSEEKLKKEIERARRIVGEFYKTPLGYKGVSRGEVQLQNDEIVSHEQYKDMVQKYFREKYSQKLSEIIAYILEHDNLHTPLKALLEGGLIESPTIIYNTDLEDRILYYYANIGERPKQPLDIPPLKYGKEVVKEETISDYPTQAKKIIDKFYKT